MEMGLLDGLKKKEPKTQTITIRVGESTVASLARLTEEFGVSQSDIIEHLLQKADEELNSSNSKTQKKK